LLIESRLTGEIFNQQLTIINQQFF